jgi:CheY-like chemotaxis protein
MRDTILLHLGMDTPQSKNRLLLVDGDPKSLRVLDVSLKKAGFEVTTATSGREALALLHANLPDLIISDTDLDEMDGFELCRQIKARPEWSKTPFLFVSGRKSIEDKIRGLELGVDDYLTKPIYIKEICIRVRTALQRAERERMESRRDGRTRFAGDLSDVGVVDLVQTIELNRKSGIIHIVNRDTRRGSIFFRDGKVIDAEVSRLSGAHAIYRLFSWSEGQFAVEFKQIRRHDVIDTPMAPLLMEGMRRLDESAHLLEKLPRTSSVLEVDCRALAEELAELPDEVNSVLRLCDGTRTLQEVLEDSEHPDLEALTFINRLFTSQIIFAREAPDHGGESEPGDRLAHWLSEGGAPDGAAVEDASASSEFAATQALASGGDVIPEKSPTPTAAAAQAASETGRPGATLAFEGQILANVEAGGQNPIDLLPKTPGPEAEPVCTNSPTLSPESKVTGRPAVLSAEESLGAILPSEADAISGASAEFAAPSDTLRGLPVDNLFGEDGAKQHPAPPATKTDSSSDAPSVLGPAEQRTTKPLGLAERMLSEDSALRASAMHEAIDDQGGAVGDAQSTDRNTREYGNPAAEAAAALVQEVVSAAHELKKDSPPPTLPERPSKEVDWGAWPAEPATTPISLPAKTVQPAPEAAQSPSSTPPGSEPAAIDPTAPPVEQASPEVTAPAGPVAPPPALAADPPAALAEQLPIHLPTPSASDGEVATSASQAGLTESAAKTPSPRPRSTTGAGGIARKPIAARQIWFMLCGAFALGAIGYLALGKGSSAPSELSLPAPPTFAAPPSSSVAPLAAQGLAKTAAEPKPAPANPGHTRPGLATPSTATAELRRKCLEVDSDGRGKAKAVSVACRPALEAEPMNVELMVILARAEIDRGRLVEARSLAKRALTADPQRFEAYVFLGTAEQEAGRIDDARAAYKKYLELAPDGPYARELRAVLNNL